MKHFISIQLFQVAQACCLLWLCSARVIASDTVLSWDQHGQNEVRTLRMIDNSDVFPAAGFRAYDNFYSPSGNPSGQTRLTERLAVGDIEYGDDAVLRDWSPSIVSDIGWTIYNRSTTGTLTSFGMMLRLYDSQLNVIAIDDAFYAGFDFLPGMGARVRSSNGLYVNSNIPTSETMFISVDFYSTNGVSAEDVGVAYGGPITFGDSSQFARNMTTGQLIDLGADPQANLGFFIDTVVPSPSSVALLAASSLFALRRRR